MTENITTASTTKAFEARRLQAVRMVTQNLPPEQWTALEKECAAVGICCRCARPAHWSSDLVHCYCDGSVCNCGMPYLHEEEQS